MTQPDDLALRLETAALLIGFLVGKPFTKGAAESCAALITEAANTIRDQAAKLEATAMTWPTEPQEEPQA